MPAQFIQVRTCCNAEPYQQQYVLFPHEKHSEVLISFLSLFTLHLQLWTFLLNIPYKQEQIYKWERILFLSENSGPISTKKILWNSEGPIWGVPVLMWLTPVEYLASWISTIWLQELAYMEVKHFESLHNKQYLGLIVTVFLRSFQPLIHKISQYLVFRGG